MLALGSPGCSVVRLFVRHHAENGPIQRKMVVECPLVITTKVKLFFRPDKTRKKELMVQPVFCIVDARSCYCWTQRTIATIQIKDTTSKDFYNGNPIWKKFTKMTIPAFPSHPSLPRVSMNWMATTAAWMTAIATTACPSSHPPSKQECLESGAGKGNMMTGFVNFWAQDFC